ncbi:hypothetical protein BDW68DRAFT_196881 [Aspergillus falconensis]
MSTSQPSLSGPFPFELNHFMLRILDPKRSLHFYIDLMGMRTVFTMNTGSWTIYYLGYPSTPEDRTDLPAWSAKVGGDNRTLTSTLGLLELYHIHGSEKPALKRLRGAGVRVIKELGVSTRESIPLSKWEEERGIGVGEIHPNYKVVFDQIAFVADPDGYTVELVPQTMN